jgi:hypothetical protein
MPKFVWEEGEQVLLQELVDYVRDGKNVPTSRLYLTDRRMVLLAPKRSAFDVAARGLLGWMAHRFGPTGEPVLAHQIRRDEFESIEQDGRSITFHDRGEGYAHTSFAIRSMTPFDTWKQRIAQWRAGTLDAAPLPKATLITRE